MPVKKVRKSKGYAGESLTLSPDRIHFGESRPFAGIRKELLCAKEAGSIAFWLACRFGRIWALGNSFMYIGMYIGLTQLVPVPLSKWTCILDNYCTPRNFL